jgi:NADP-dependent 3-hydroxy acid dehydrogenase YdfG
MPFQYKHVLMVGATAGIGRAMAERLIQEGSKVTVVGRRKERLDEFVTKYGEKKAQSAPFDISKLDEIPRFAAEYASFTTNPAFLLHIIDTNSALQCYGQIS